MRLTQGRPSHTFREWERTDPDYDDPLYPRDVWEAIVLVPIALVIFLAFMVGIGLVFVMLSPAPQ